MSAAAPIEAEYTDDQWVKRPLVPSVAGRAGRLKECWNQRSSSQATPMDGVVVLPGGTRTMDSSTQMGSLIGFDAATLGTPGAVNRGRRSTDRVDGSSFAEVYDLAAFASTGSREAARVPAPAPLHALPAAPAPVGYGTLSVAPSAPTTTSLDAVDRTAADRLYLHLTTGGSWMRMTDDQSGTVVMRLHDADGTPVREMSITELQHTDDEGPEVA
jgi:hypothetical protein